MRISKQLVPAEPKRLNRYDFLKRLVLMPKTHDTETDAYAWIRFDLREKGWNTKNPSKHADGEVFTHHEVFGHVELKKFLNRGVPENIVKITESDFWVIEAKKSHSELDKALDEAINYSNDINKSKSIRALISYRCCR